MKRLLSIFLVLSFLFALGSAPVLALEEGEDPSYPPMAEKLAPDASSEGSVTIYAAEGADVWLALGEEYQRLTGISISLSQNAHGADILIGEKATVQSLLGECKNLSDSAISSLLRFPAYALFGQDGSIRALPLSLDVAGIAVNTQLLEKAGYTLDRLDGFKALRRFSTSVKDRKDDLGFFSWAPMALSEGSENMITQVLYNVPLYVELQEQGKFTGKYVGDYADSHYKDLFTLMLDFGTKTGNDVLSVTKEESLGAFARGEALFCLVEQNDIAALSAQGMDISTVAFIPPWMGMPGEKDLGFVADTRLYLAVPSANPACAEDFLYWCFQNEQGVSSLAKSYDGLPFEGCTPTNPLLLASSLCDEAGLVPIPMLNRSFADGEGWNSYFLSQLRFIVSDNKVWRWQEATWKLADIYAGKG